MSLDSRIEKINLSLSPKQAVLTHVARLQRFRSFRECQASMFARSGAVHPLQQLSEQAERNVEETLSEAEDHKIERAVQIALRDLGFLFFLHEHLNELITNREGLLAALSELIDEKLGRMIASSPRKVNPWSHDELVLQSRFERFVRTVEAFAEGFYSLTATVRNIEDKYFNGNSILFSLSKQAMKEMREQFERGVTLYNNLAPQCPWPQPPIDLENLRTAANKTARAMCADLVDMARADALNHLGDRAGGHRIARRIAERMAGTDLQET